MYLAFFNFHHAPLAATSLQAQPQAGVNKPWEPVGRVSSAQCGLSRQPEVSSWILAFWKSINLQFSHY